MKAGFLLKNNTHVFIFLLISFILSFLQNGYTEIIQTIYISQQDGTDIDNLGDDVSKPIRTLARARVIALSNWRNVDGFEILFKGGEQFDEFLPITNQVLKDYDPLRNSFAFVWDIDRSLKISTFGSLEKAILYSNKYTHEGGPQAAIAVTTPSTQNVIIENLHFKHWQVCAFFAYKTRNIQFLNNIVEEIGTLYFPDEKTAGIYGAGAIYPKNSSNVFIQGNYIRNIHNQFDMLDKMHVFYLTRLNNSEICDNIIINASGPPLKFRRSQTNNVYVHDNEFYYTGPSQSLNQVQEGWVRYSGDADDGCPYAIVLEHNLFYYPYCWENTQECDNALAVKYSISNTSVCGVDACEDEEKVKWIDNDYRYEWEPYTVPDIPTRVERTIVKKIETFELFGNYPNPFNPVTEICFRIPTRNQTRLTIYNELGKAVRVLVNRRLESGFHRFTFDASELPSGIYFYRLQSGELHNTKKMVLIK